MNSSILLPLYKSLGRLHLEYCIQVWRTYLLKDIKILEKVQRRVTRMFSDYKGLQHSERLGKVKLLKLETRRIKADLLTIRDFKIFNGLEGLDKRAFISTES